MNSRAQESRKRSSRNLWVNNGYQIQHSTIQKFESKLYCTSFILYWKLNSISSTHPVVRLKGVRACLAIDGYFANVATQAASPEGMVIGTGGEEVFSLEQWKQNEVKRDLIEEQHRREVHDVLPPDRGGVRTTLNLSWNGICELRQPEAAARSPLPSMMY